MRVSLVVQTANRVSVAGPENFSVGLCESQEGPQSVWKVGEQALRCCCRRLGSGEVLSVLRSDLSLISCAQRGFCFSWLPQPQGPAVELVRLAVAAAAVGIFERRGQDRPQNPLGPGQRVDRDWYTGSTAIELGDLPRTFAGFDSRCRGPEWSGVGGRRVVVVVVG